LAGQPSEAKDAVCPDLSWLHAPVRSAGDPCLGIANAPDAGFRVQAMVPAMAEHEGTEIFSTDQECQFISTEFAHPLLARRWRHSQAITAARIAAGVGFFVRFRRWRVLEVHRDEHRRFPIAAALRGDAGGGGIRRGGPAAR
jgi:hypothetical protein